ncbi:amidohydrolase [Hymenobacter profundi]|uniref:Amidohydrolase n=1 Tax=Hymenobacter profundi TaxID=1982110 RepID=A0ABS6X3M2_9BACT|nr:amidohydrolase [Hymenobacter profundi]MBW3130437.1 amidohydrolase [Hymenobacter profundi]
MADFTLSFVQTALHWHQPATNRALLEHHIDTISLSIDLIVLPEMFATGFTMEAAALAEDMDGPTVQWMQRMAAARNAVVTGSLIIRDNGQHYNRLLWVRPDGTLSYYDKRHRFGMAGETNVYAAGQARLLEEWRGWRICPLVCYDLRFPVWSRNAATAPYDLLLYVANWPAARRDAWMALLRARAIENVAYVLGVNRVGTDGNNLEYAGDSALLDMRGDYLVEVGNQETSITRTLRRTDLDAFREQFPALYDADTFEVRPDDPASRW